ncbi:MAG TPA: DUF2147 domain-containing protein [Paludibacteraceae bacterium]|nr:DUF2147 domain-containing protein [Paludibacteraceae bacterium]HPT42845.1 DUF2147 domain-containing protein [Paludibacteraceae bacterium]
MKKLIMSLMLLCLIAAASFAQTDKIVGRWKTIDDKDGSEKSVINIYKSTNGKYYGKIEKLFKEPEKLCTECEGTHKNKPVLGMVIVNNMTESEGTLTGGTILDPKDGKVYQCNISYNAKKANLKVRGSLDRKGIIGRTQYWVKVK